MEDFIYMSYAFAFLVLLALLIYNSVFLYLTQNKLNTESQDEY